MISPLGPGKMECKCPQGKGFEHFLGCLAHWIALESTGFWGSYKRASGAKIGEQIHVLRKELPFRGHVDYTCIKIFSGINFVNHG